MQTGVGGFRGLEVGFIVDPGELVASQYLKGLSGDLAGAKSYKIDEGRSVEYWHESVVAM